MPWKKHYVKYDHSFLSPSSYHWLNYDHEKLIKTYLNVMYSKAHGTEMHELAKLLIKNRQELPDEQKTFNMYVNDAIKYKMSPEVLLYYSDNCFGTADAIIFDNKKRTLRIHDLKTGTIKASMNQLKIYAALFCLDYDVDPNRIKNMTLQIYQNDEVSSEEPDASEISEICDKIIEFDEVLENLKEDLNNV